MESELQELKDMRRRRGSEEPKMDITPMIDVTFLLLIFLFCLSLFETVSYSFTQIRLSRFGRNTPKTKAIILTYARFGKAACNR